MDRSKFTIPLINGLASKLNRWFVICSIVVVSSLSIGWKLLDPKANHSLLRELYLELDKAGIDVMQDWNSKVKTSMKPILAPLANYPVSFTPAEQRWIDELNTGAIGAITAIKSAMPIEESDFFQRWNSVEKERRIFISFAREDVAVAGKVKKILESKGYVAFMYLNEGEVAPGQSVFKAGQFLGSAGDHIILDTEIARKKDGVMAEALFHAQYIHPTTVNYHVVHIYGPNDCPRTKQALKYFKETGAKVSFHNVRTSSLAYTVAEQNRRYLESDGRGGRLYPFIRVDGKPVHPKDFQLTLTKCYNKGPLQ